jgi:hypothetical protein
MNAKEAVAAARTNLVEIFADDLDAPPQLEEVRFDTEKASWLVTFTIRRKTADVNRMSRMLGPAELKVVSISDTDGKFIGIVNREPMTAWR